MKSYVWILALLLVAAHAAAAEQQIVIKGSNTFGEELAPRLLSEYRQSHPDVTFTLESKGSGSGFAALLAGECDIATSSRPVNEDEQRMARSRKIRMNSYIIGYYGVAVIVNAASPLASLSHEQVSDIFTGKIQNWKQLGGPDAPVQIFIRDPVSGTYLGFQELAMDRRPYAAAATMLKSYGAIAEAVRRDKHAIGSVGMNLADYNGVKALRINKVLPTVTSVNEADYPYSRTLRLYTERGRETRAARDFIQFILSRKGQNLLSEMGFVRRFEQRLWSPEM